MDRKNFLFKRRIRYMILLLTIFMTIILSFDFVVFSITKNALYEDCDTQMMSAKEHVFRNPEGAIENFLKGKQIIYYDNGSNYVISYKIFLLVRDEMAEILNAQHLNAFSYILELPFQKDKTEIFLTQKMDKNYEKRYFRTFSFSVPGADAQIYHIQLATDVTDLQTPLSIFMNMLAICTAVATVVMILVGWYLSKLLVKGVVEAWEQQDEFISYASHEIRSPLAVIHSSLELLLERPGAKIIDRSDLILNSLSETSRLRKMTSNLLEMVKLQTAELPIHKEEIDLQEMIEAFIEPFTYQAESTGKVLHHYVDANLMLYADRQLITELLVIFLENALKYTEKGDVIRIFLTGNGSDVVIRIEDSGIGISEDGLTKVFSRFYREERHQAKADGSGLGLYIANLIVQAHGGRVSASQNVPRGTVFTTVIPGSWKR